MKPTHDTDPNNWRKEYDKQKCFFKLVDIHRRRAADRGRVVGKWDAYAVADRWLRAHWDQEEK